jgi:hypothetical protein
VLRAVVGVLRERAGFGWAGIAFVEERELTLGPEAGERGEAMAAFPVAFRGERVAELQVSPAPGPDDTDARTFLERVALLISPHCLVGWDTGGEPWEP